MRTVHISRTATSGLQRLLDQGLPKFGPLVVAEKLQLVDDAIYVKLRPDPRTGFYDEQKRVHAYPVSDTRVILFSISPPQNCHPVACPRDSFCNELRSERVAEWVLPTRGAG